MNSWNFTGNIGNDCETRSLSNGDSVVSFNVATKAGYGDKATTTWVRCSMFGKRADAVAPYLLKGQLVGVCGELSNKEYDAKDGTKKSSLEVRVNDLTLLGKGDGAKSAPARPAPAASSGGGIDDLDSDLPF